VHLALVIGAPQKLTQRGAENISRWIVSEETGRAHLPYSGKMKAEKISDCCVWIHQNDFFELMDHAGTKTKPFCE